MSSPSLSRVQQDLDVIKSALSADFPYDRGSLLLAGLAASTGIPFALRAVPGWNAAMTGLLIALAVLILAVYSLWLRRVRAERGFRPRRWSCSREEAIGSAVAVSGVIVYLLLARFAAADGGEWTYNSWRGRLGGPVLFAVGVGLTAIGAARWERRCNLGWGLGLTALGAAIPWLDSRAAFWIYGGIAIAVGGLVSTWILWLQLRNWEQTHGGH